MTSTVNMRELALGILLDIEKGGQYSHIALANVLDKYQYLDKKERAFLTRLTEGTLEQLIQIDYIIDQFSKVPVRKMKPVIRCIIQSAVYQIRSMDAIPDSAACNEAVRLAQKKGFRSLSGFVNGVLRSISRAKDQPGRIVWPDCEKEPAAYLSVRYSIPEWMIQMWMEEFSYEPGSRQDFQKIEHMLQAFCQPAPVTICTNTLYCTPQELEQKLKAEGVTVKKSKILPCALNISGYDHLSALKSFQEGLFYVQDISSMLAAQAACPKEHDFVIDVCAAPGGKSMHIAQLMHGTGRVLARDLIQRKIELIKENIARCRVPNVETQIWDARIPDESNIEKADIVIADLPCSGLGVMRGKKDIRYKMTPDKMKDLVQLQREILSVAVRYVRPGGRLIYSTCTIHRDENQGNAQWLAGEHTELQLMEDRQILPTDEGGDGFYIAVFVKKQ